MLAAMRDLAGAARESQAKCERLAAVSDCFTDLVAALSTIDDVCRVQRSCLPDDEVVTQELLERRTRPREASTAAAASRGGTSGTASTRRAPRKSTSSSLTAAARRKAAALEDFRAKLPRSYQTEAGIAMMLGLRRLIKQSDADGGLSLAQAREHLGGGRSLMQCSQVLEVLCRLGHATREVRDRKQGVRFFAAGPKRRAQGGRGR